MQLANVAASNRPARPAFLGAESALDDGASFGGAMLAELSASPKPLAAPIQGVDSGAAIVFLATMPLLSVLTSDLAASQTTTLAPASPLPAPGRPLASLLRLGTHFLSTLPETHRPVHSSPATAEDGSASESNALADLSTTPIVPPLASSVPATIVAPFAAAANAVAQAGAPLQLNPLLAPLGSTRVILSRPCVSQQLTDVGADLTSDLTAPASVTLASANVILPSVTPVMPFAVSSDEPIQSGIASAAANTVGATPSTLANPSTNAPAQPEPTVATGSPAEALMVGRVVPLLHSNAPADRPPAPKHPDEFDDLVEPPATAVPKMLTPINLAPTLVTAVVRTPTTTAADSPQVQRVAARTRIPASASLTSVDIATVAIPAPNPTALPVRADEPALADTPALLRPVATSRTAAVTAPLPASHDSPADTTLPQFQVPSTPIDASAAADTAVATVRVSTQPAQLAHDVGLAIARQLSANGNTLHIRLDPSEFGRIDVSMNFDDRGNLRAVLSADSARSLDLLRRDSADLGRSLTDAGVRADSQSFRFESSSDGRGTDSGQQRPTPTPLATDAAESLRETPEPARFQPLRWRGQVDVVA